MIDNVAALAIARAEAERVRGERALDVELEAIDGGWNVRWIVGPESDPLVGIHRLIIDDQGSVHRYPSSLSPRMARERFAHERATG